MNYIDFAFIFTATMLIIALFKIIPLMWGRSVSLPMLVPFTGLTPTHFLVLYPSVMFQIWFWAERLGVLAQ